MDFTRRGSRIAVDIAITVTSILDSVEARIIDMSEHGAQILGASMNKGDKFQIEYMGQVVYAQCMWSEIDRMGVRFPFDLTDGPLHDAMVMASTSTDMVSEGFVPALSSYPAPGYSAMAPRRSATSGFGRRNAA